MLWEARPWNEARISYLHKKGSKTEVSNYRPVSLISVLAKTFTKAWVGRLQDIAADHLVKLISVLAKTFTKALVGRLRDIAADHLGKKQGRGVCGQKGQGAPGVSWISWRNEFQRGQ